MYLFGEHNVEISLSDTYIRGQKMNCDNIINRQEIAQEYQYLQNIISELRAQGSEREQEDLWFGRRSAHVEQNLWRCGAGDKPHPEGIDGCDLTEVRAANVSARRRRRRRRAGEDMDGADLGGSA